ncbi:PREDICTED: phosphoglycerate mutase-like protein AT74 [Erythranthe guttata]|nr:PREDICTED: phosphoglycerate mutase-like protein AT74 [Erythranthe guttata]|eukprot:XP_012830044.1 PREDICTED: phosphoglycerate mutase-like protein AT74 [Erythranthe guttata]
MTKPIEKSQLPKRIILVRHGESEGNENEAVLEYVPNYKIKLSKKGIHQAQQIGSKIKEIVSENKGSKMFFYVSPSNRTRETTEHMIESTNFPRERVVGVREECRLREQHFGNYQEIEARRKIKCKRNNYGKFFYRVPDGESSADVYDRVSTFVEGMWRDMESNKLMSMISNNNNNNGGDEEEVSLIVVSHGLTILLFLMKWFNWTVDQFENLTNPTNCEYRVLELGFNGEYSLSFHHHLHQLQEWGLSEDMIRDQQLRAHGRP